MEKGTLHPYKLEDPGTSIVAEAPPSQSQAQAPSDGHRAPALFFSSDDDESDEGEEFEFPFVSRDSPAGTAAPADELFADGRIRPFYYPVFGRGVFSEPARPAQHHPAAAAPRVRGRLGRLFLEESRARNASVSSSTSTASSSSSDVEGVPPESYCLWAPGGGSSAAGAASPRRCRKSGSTGSVLHWRRISDRLVGRSHSDGKEKFVFLNAAGVGVLPPPPPGISKDEQEGGGGKGHASGDAGLPLRYYSRGGGGVGGSGRRRSYLPYKQELVGLFAHVSGLRRSYHPF